MPESKRPPHATTWRDPEPHQFEGGGNDSLKPPEAGLIVGNDYSQMMQVHPRRGRLLVDTDGEAGPPVVSVNESFAAKYWAGEDALGKHLGVFEERSPVRVWRWLASCLISSRMLGRTCNTTRWFICLSRRDPIGKHF